MQALEKPPMNEGETYIGFISDHKGEGHHVILLPGDAEDLEWQQAVEWAEKQGGDLPTRVEQALLWANHQDQFKKDWYWSNETHRRESGWAWFQTFSYGYQDDFSKYLEVRARAVRRLPI